MASAATTRQERPSIYTRLPQLPRPTGPGVNVGEAERWISLLGGGALALYGLAKGSWGGLALSVVGGSLLYRGATGHCSLYRTLGITTAEPRSSAASIPADYGVKVERSVLINRSPADLYLVWHNFENLPRIFRHLVSVRSQGNRSHWVAKGPLGTEVAWDAEIINEKENELIAWRSLDNAQVDSAGSVHFTPAQGGQGTEVRVVLKYNPPGGKIGSLVARLFGEEPGQQISEDLQRFKDWMETGTRLTNPSRTSSQGK
ncbi:MAG: DUF2892 domain-containing protein [Planctomycetes bacterium]|nr:DUF2892 domain-containing protein [Planctomycetota bacterium]